MSVLRDAVNKVEAETPKGKAEASTPENESPASDGKELVTDKAKAKPETLTRHASSVSTALIGSQHHRRMAMS
jgi:hypothetical protein